MGGDSPRWYLRQSDQLQTFDDLQHHLILHSVKKLENASKVARATLHVVLSPLAGVLPHHPLRKHLLVEAFARASRDLRFAESLRPCLGWGQGAG